MLILDRTNRSPREPPVLHMGLAKSSEQQVKQSGKTEH
ncbi:hypothetical protein SAMN05192541_12822 [Bradyrhizobium arachidis]|nr:hypothetical protein SAMN05192541_12822 [Bradyrhizobium arachidis]